MWQQLCGGPPTLSPFCPLPRSSLFADVAVLRVNEGENSPTGHPHVRPGPVHRALHDTPHDSVLVAGEFLSLTLSYGGDR